MAGKTITMLKIRIVLQNKLHGKSDRVAARAAGISRNTLKVYLDRLRQCDLDFGELLKLEDASLMDLVYLPSDTSFSVSDPRLSGLLVYLERVMPELGKKGVTRHQLWEEYRLDQPNGHGYSQFCEHIRLLSNQKKVTMRFEHRAAEVMQVDFAGDKLSYVDRRTGEVHSCEVLVCVLPHSGYTFVIALPSQKQADFCDGIAAALYFFGGVPESILSDNLKSAVIKSDRYEPIFNELLAQLSAHYDTTIRATRPSKPRDKASVEGAVVNAYRKIYAPLRKLEFHSLSELNKAILAQLEVLNTTPFQGKNFSRKDAFDVEKAALRPLPTMPFEVVKVVKAKVQMNYHVLLGEDKHYYSVPYTAVGKASTIHYSATKVEVYVDQKRIALHTRQTGAHGYSTVEAHMPPAHQAHKTRQAWSQETFLEKAKAIGPQTEKAVARALESRVFVQQSFTTCMGIFRLAGKYGHERLEKACEMIIPAPHVSYRMLDNILKHNTDQLTPAASQTVVEHDNVRGAQAYQ